MDWRIKEQLAQEKLRNADLISKNEELNIGNEELNIRNEELVSSLQIANEKIDKLEDISRVLAAKVSQIPDTVENSEFVQELLDGNCSRRD